jgi:hypothetical protein
MFKTKWRIVTDKYNGYEIQKKFWWFPIWFQVGSYDGSLIGTNSFTTLDSASQAMRKFAEQSAFKSKVVTVYEPQS